MVNRFMTSGDPAPRGDVRAEARLLGSVPTFAGATARDLERIVRAGHVVQVPDRWALLHRGTPADAAYVLLGGLVDVRRDRLHLNRCGRGEVLGELGILAGRLRSATVVSATPLTALRLSRSAVHHLRDSVPYFGEVLDAARAEHSLVA